MARFHFSLRSATPAPAGAAPLRVARGWPLDAAIDTPAVGQGPGWFESSWELVRGLEVREGLPGDARLNEWLEAHARAEPLLLATDAEPCDAFARFGIDGLALA